MPISAKQAARTVDSKVKAHVKALEQAGAAQRRVEETWEAVQEALKVQVAALPAGNGKAVAATRARHEEEE